MVIFIVFFGIMLFLSFCITVLYAYNLSFKEDKIKETKIIEENSDRDILINLIAELTKLHESKESPKQIFEKRMQLIKLYSDKLMEKAEADCKGSV